MHLCPSEVLLIWSNSSIFFSSDCKSFFLVCSLSVYGEVKQSSPLVPQELPLHDMLESQRFLNTIINFLSSQSEFGSSSKLLKTDVDTSEKVFSKVVGKWP
ncbi:hypothetical protein XENOCAPTIV_013094 [Xenoophorus captivus]|uniref:Uncharacterized protein n=1 Tax=Xenoophorus captivus TaxID=1517983 RepID=A0ABV0S0E7_9TELE